MNKVVFLGIDFKPSIDAGKLIQCMDCDLVVSHTKRSKFDDFPDEYDLGISFMYRNLVPKKELKKALWINIHPAPLPSYGGRNIAYHAILNKETKFGASIHYMSDEFDKGDIIHTSWFDVPLNSTSYELYDLSCAESIKLIDKFIPKILDGETLTSKKQINHKYYKKTEIDDTIYVDDTEKNKILALYYPPYYPKVKIGDKIFKLILDK